MRRDLLVFAVVLALLGALAAGAFVVLRGVGVTPRVEWDTAEVDGDRLRVTYEDSGCMDFDDVYVFEADDRVELTLRGRSHWGFCGDVYRVHRDVVVLEEPLGERTVYDGACLAREPGDDESCAREPVPWGAPSPP